MEVQTTSLPDRALAQASPPLFSSSPAFGTPLFSSQPPKPAPPAPKATTLSILLPPATLRPLAFRTFTKKHNLTLASTALQALATFIGKHCGSKWREEGLAEKVLEKAARIWKNDGGGIIVEADNNLFGGLLQQLESCVRRAEFQSAAWDSQNSTDTSTPDIESQVQGADSGLKISDFVAPKLKTTESYPADSGQGPGGKEVRSWLKLINALEQPQLIYDPLKKHFEKSEFIPSLLPDPSHKIRLFRHRYNLILQRLLRNEAFQTPTIALSRTPTLQRSSSMLTTAEHAYKLTPIANLLGRSGSTHLLLGLLSITPTGSIALSDLTGSIVLDLRYTKPLPADGAVFTPGMIVLVDGVYEEEGSSSNTVFAGGSGVGGTVGGKFFGISMRGPPCERREVTLGIGDSTKNQTAGGGFGWVDFLGVGSERASGARMRSVEKSMLKSSEGAVPPKRGRVVILGEVNLDSTKTMEALKKLLGHYALEAAEEMPMAYVLVGNFVEYAVMAGGGSGGSIEYKEYFDGLASALSEFPTVLQSATFIFIPGDNDPWSSSFSAGAATVIPRKGVPDLFTSRVKKAFSSANSESLIKSTGEALWATNPARLSLFGPIHEIAIFRDDMSSRIRRSQIGFPSQDQEPEGHGERAATVNGEPMEVDGPQAADTQNAARKNERSKQTSLSPDQVMARKLVKTILDQGYLSPFPLAKRPVLWNYAGALQLYPLPTALVLVDPDAAPFTVTYEGCHVMNPGRFVAEGRKGVAKWIEYDAGIRRGKQREIAF
ncbi:MAG: DNA-directed DNA polymerase epsilon, subunit B [Icmadophila ericetorum]|nr:DNA-directed DNA polymerase epsilon, subunit B [Icmadophila ericetorum]